MVPLQAYWTRCPSRASRRLARQDSPRGWTRALFACSNLLIKPSQRDELFTDASTSSPAAQGYLTGTSNRIGVRFVALDRCATRQRAIQEVQAGRDQVNGRVDSRSWSMCKIVHLLQAERVRPLKRGKEITLSTLPSLFARLAHVHRGVITRTY